MTDDEVSDFAKRIYRGEIFVSWMMDKADERLLGSVFMALTFLSDEQRQQMIDDKVTCVWAPYADQIGGSINGYPMFTSLGMWTQEEAKRVHTKLQEIAKAMEAL